MRVFKGPREPIPEELHKTRYDTQFTPSDAQDDRSEIVPSLKRRSGLVVLKQDHGSEPLPSSGPPATEAQLAEAFLSQFQNHNTRSAYQSDLSDFRDYASQHSVSLIEAARETIQIYLRNVAEAGARPATLARRLATLRGFYRYALEAGALVNDPTTYVKPVRVPKDSVSLGLDLDDARRLLHAAEEVSPMQHALVSLLLLNGLRVSEAVGTQISDLDTLRGRPVLWIRRKGGKREPVPLARHTHETVIAAIGRATLGPIFVTDSRSIPLTRQNASRIIRQLGQNAGLTRPVTPHVLRHTAATLALDCGIPLQEVQDLLGHADPETTRRYDSARRLFDGSAVNVLSRTLRDGEPFDHGSAPTEV